MRTVPYRTLRGSQLAVVWIGNDVSLIKGSPPMAQQGLRSPWRLHGAPLQALDNGNVPVLLPNVPCSCLVKHKAFLKSKAYVPEIKLPTDEGTGEPDKRLQFKFEG
jgi:hypothetical protein